MKKCIKCGGEISEKTFHATPKGVCALCIWEIPEHIPFEQSNLYWENYIKKYHE